MSLSLSPLPPQTEQWIITLSSTLTQDTTLQKLLHNVSLDMSKLSTVIQAGSGVVCEFTGGDGSGRVFLLSMVGAGSEYEGLGNVRRLVNYDEKENNDDGADDDSDSDDEKPNKYTLSQAPHKHLSIQLKPSIDVRNDSLISPSFVNQVPFHESNAQKVRLGYTKIEQVQGLKRRFCMGGSGGGEVSKGVKVAKAKSEARVEEEVVVKEEKTNGSSSSSSAAKKPKKDKKEKKEKKSKEKN